jgi:hypothetical protein
MHACSWVVVLVDDEVVAVVVLIGLVELGESVYGESWDFGLGLPVCFCEMILEVGEVIVDFGFAGFYCCKSWLDIWNSRNWSRTGDGSWRDNLRKFSPLQESRR